MQTAERSVTTGRHPLDPLSAEEIETASVTLRAERRLDEGVRFVSVNLNEPTRDVVLAFRQGDAIDREAAVLLRDKTRRTTYAAVVSVTRAWSPPGGRSPTCSRRSCSRSSWPPSRP